MDNTPTEAPAPAGESVETPINTNQAPTQAPVTPDMHGFTSEDLAGMRTFIDNNGGWDRIKSRISNPEPAQPQNPTSQPQAQPVEPQIPQQPEQPKYTPPEGSITAQEFLAHQYFQGLSKAPQYEGISEQIANGDVLKEMASFNIQPLNEDGSINDKMVRQFLDLKAQTVPAKGTSTEPGASAAPTVDYVPTNGSIENIDQAYRVITQDGELKRAGLSGHPDAIKAEEFIKNHLAKGK